MPRMEQSGWDVLQCLSCKIMMISNPRTTTTHKSKACGMFCFCFVCFSRLMLIMISKCLGLDGRRRESAWSENNNISAMGQSKRGKVGCGKRRDPYINLPHDAIFRGIPRRWRWRWRWRWQAGNLIFRLVDWLVWSGDNMGRHIWVFWRCAAAQHQLFNWLPFLVHQPFIHSTGYHFESVILALCLFLCLLNQKLILTIKCDAMRDPSWQTNQYWRSRSGWQAGKSNLG